jgi:hypothetical protein
MFKSASSAKHTHLVSAAVDWLRHEYGCGIILSEQFCATGEIPDAIGWKGINRSVVVECKVSRADFLADAIKPFRLKPEEGLGCERLYMAPQGVIALEELPVHWGLLECTPKCVSMLRTSERRGSCSPAFLPAGNGSCYCHCRRTLFCDIHGSQEGSFSTIFT